MKYLFSSLCIIFGLTLIDARADEQLDAIKTGELQFTLALGYGGIENPRAKSDNITTYVLPSWSYYGERFYAENFTLGYSLYESDRFIVDLQTRLNEDGIFFELDGWSNVFLSDILGYKPNKQPLFGPKIPEVPIERHISYLGGVNTSWLTPHLDINLGYYHDISGVHQGNEIHLKLKTIQPLSWGALAFEVGAIRKSSQLIKYYYHFTEAELGRPIRESAQSASINYHASGVINIPLWQDINFVGIVTYTWLGDEISDNLMVEKDDYLSGFVGVSYAF
ncbi:MipA/OmpV family protein [Shewanella colwelliana]|uniref:MipA/OmpV family protein n=1 Tax=Shewanella colwelliana TaxID=23 RepID=UPI00299E9C3D|nr:MipA/OmpV family protein [Shewanella colwelliana]MDX1279692.1 MipA/OmpV family protein [Shewanella colwelliana]